MTDRTANLPAGGPFAVSETSGILYHVTPAGIGRWDMEAGQALATLPLSGNFTDLAVSPDGRYLLVGSGATIGGAGGRVALMFRYDLQTMARTEIRCPLPDQEGGVANLAIADTGRVLFTTKHTGSGATPVRSFDIAATPPVFNVVPVDMSDEGSELIRSADGGRVLIVEPNGDVNVYVAATGAVVEPMTFRMNGPAVDGAITADRVAVVYGGKVEILDAALNLIQTIPVAAYGDYAEAEFSADGRWLYLFNGATNLIEVWDTANWSKVGSADPHLATSDFNFFLGGLDLTGNGELAVIVTSSGLRVIDLVARITAAFQGTAAADDITGTIGADAIGAFDSADIVQGGRGDDTFTPLNTAAAPGSRLGSVDGGAGFDTLDVRGGGTVAFTADTDSFLVTIGGRAVEATGIERILTGVGDQVISFESYGSGLTIDAGAGADQLTGSAFADTLIGGDGADRLEGRGGDDRLEGGAGADHLQGGDGDDVVNGGTGADTLYGFQSGMFAPTGPQRDVIHGGADGDAIYGVSGSSLYGDEGNDTITAYGGTGTELLILDGGAQTARDTLRLRGAGELDVTTGLGHLGATPIQASGFEQYVISWDLAGDFTLTDGDGGSRIVIETTNQSFNGVIHAGGGADIVSGGYGEDQIYGGDGDDRLDGGWTGYDTLSGGAGDDYIVNNQGANTLVGGAGIDTVDYSGAFGATVTVRLDLGQAVDGVTNDVVLEIEHVIGAASRPNTLVGNAAANHLTGGSSGDSISGGDGDDVLRGRGGVDALHGGGGIDTVDYSGAAAGMRAQLNTNASTNDGDGGTDTFSGIENLTGSAFNDVLIGDGIANVLRGGLGADTLLGLGGNDTLWGGSGALNTLQGGLGDDVYVLEAADSIVENVGEGTDTVDARINTYVLANNVEALIFGGTGNFAGTGNALANVITGGAGNDALRGRGGIDVLNGGLGTDTADYTLAAAGVVARIDLQRATNDGDGATDTYTSIENLIGSNFNDTLIGDNNANVLMGGIGTDTLLGFGGNDILMGGSGGGNNQMQGGLGDDWYILDAFDTCVETAGQGTDTVEARVGSYTLGANIENLLYTGPGGFTGSGNALDNVITGGNQNDVLRGKGGNDVINGGLGADEVQFVGTKAQYTVTVEGAGYRIVDTIAARDGSTFVTSIEKLRFLTGNTTTNLSYPPVAPGALEPVDKSGAEDFGGPLVSSPMDEPEVLPGTGDDGFVMDKAADLPLVLPSAFDDGLQRPEVAGRAALWRLAMDGAHNPLIVDGPHGPQLLHDRVNDFDPFPGLADWA